MNIKILFGTIMALALFTTGYAQRLDKAKLDQFFDSHPYLKYQYQMIAVIAYTVVPSPSWFLLTVSARDLYPDAY